jgi:hypothetical protein
MIYTLFLGTQMFKLQSAVEFIPLHIISLCIQSPLKSVVFLVTCFKTPELKNWRIHLEVGNSLLMSSKIVLNGDNGLELCKPYATLGFLWTDTIILNSVRHAILLPLRELNKQQERKENLVSCSTFHDKSHDDIQQYKLLDNKL